MQFSVTILGSGASLPTTRRNVSSHLVEVRNRFLLFDCGEGTQVQLRRLVKRVQRISHIFITHLHGDHYYGLIGLITSFHLLGRKKELHVYGPEPLREIIDIQLRYSHTELIYPLIFHPLDPARHAVAYEDDHIEVLTIPLLHTVPTCGYLVKEKQLRRKIVREFANSHELEPADFEEIKNGNDYKESDGSITPNRDITLDPPAPRSYAYCTDTGYDESIVPLIKGVSLLYHEATFSDELVSSADEKQHSTARQAAEVARQADAGRLIIGHFSARYKNAEELLSEAITVFPATILAEDGLVVKL